MLEKKPQHRFASATDVEQTLCRLLAKWQQGGLRRRPRFTHRWLGYVASTALVVAVGAVAIYQIPFGTSQKALPTDSSPEKETTDEKALQLAEFDMAEQESIERKLQVLESLSSESIFARPSDSFHQSVDSIDQALYALDGVPHK